MPICSLSAPVSSQYLSVQQMVFLICCNHIVKSVILWNGCFMTATHTLSGLSQRRQTDRTHTEKTERSVYDSRFPEELKWLKKCSFFLSFGSLLRTMRHPVSKAKWLMLNGGRDTGKKYWPHWSLQHFGLWFQWVRNQSVISKGHRGLQAIKEQKLLTMTGHCMYTYNAQEPLRCLKTRWQQCITEQKSTEIILFPHR